MRKLLPLYFMILCFMCGFAPHPTLLRIRTIDARTGAKIEVASVYLAENGTSAESVRGVTTLTVPYSPDTRYKSPPPFGTVTLVVRADGYIPTVLIGCVVYEHVTRNVDVSLFYDDGSIETECISIVESPPQKWLDSLLKPSEIKRLM